MAAITDESVLTLVDSEYSIDYSRDILITSSTVASLDASGGTGEDGESSVGFFKKHERLLIVAGVAVAALVVVRYL